MMQYDFRERLEWSKGNAGESDAETIRNLLVGCVGVEAAPEHLDRIGIDFVATLRRGAKVNIDVKRREKGVSRFWKTEPELTLEQWSVCPTETGSGSVGWTLDERKATDYVLYVFDISDCEVAYLIPFQLLRMAFRKNNAVWRQHFRVGRCNTDKRYETESVFVPASCVIEAVAAEMICELSA
jgi:hypothetical protein